MEDESQHKTQSAVSSCFARIFFIESSKDFLHKEVIVDLMKVLSDVRTEVFGEHRWFLTSGNGSKNNERLTSVHPVAQTEVDDSLVSLSKRNRLLYLFVRDLTSGVSGDVLAGKMQRDSNAKRDGVSWGWQAMGWAFVFVTNFGMLFYVYLFAMAQTQSRQSAWFQSFVIWIFFELFVSSTGLVLLTHILIPLYVLSDVSSIKEKVLLHLMTFREKYLKTRLYDVEAPAPPPRSVDAQLQEFNSAKYLFTSWRVASLCPDLPESALILQFSTPWPKKKFGQKQAEVSTEYDQAVILTALSRILLYFLTSLLHFHTLIQDIILQTICNSGFGILGVLLIQLWALHPSLPVCVVAMVVLGLYLMFRWLSGRNTEFVKKLSSIRPLPTPPPVTTEGTHIATAATSAAGSELQLPPCHPSPEPSSPPLPSVPSLSPPSSAFSPSDEDSSSCSSHGLSSSSNHASDSFIPQTPSGQVIRIEAYLSSSNSD